MSTVRPELLSDLPWHPDIRVRRSHDVLRHDCTANPIFLLQSRRFFWAASAPYAWDSEQQIMVGDDGKEVPESLGVAEGHAVEIWDVERVFFTREEGELWGTQHAYRFPDGWRVFCVCAQGDLATVLGFATIDGAYR